MSLASHPMWVFSGCRTSTPSQKFLVLWWIEVSPEGMEPLMATGADIAKRVGMTTDDVRVRRQLHAARRDFRSPHCLAAPASSPMATDC
ncbi:hypothetical protein ACIP6X_34380 [Streptomyces coeruleorubidus]|uniref:hypothetical protein n=1 Tax=Streptomyces coeruleorubidus TaxID=116188 RepID=UPI00382F14E0